MRTSREAAGQPEPEERYAELRRAEGRVLEGIAIRYGEEAPIAGQFRERFVAGAFGDLSAADVALVFQHVRERPLARTGGAGLELSDGPGRLEVRADLPNTTDADDALELVKVGVLRGLSVRFHAVEATFEGNLRTVHKADLVSIGLVDQPAYAGSRVGLAELAERWAAEANTNLLRKANTNRRRIWL